MSMQSVLIKISSFILRVDLPVTKMYSNDVNSYWKLGVYITFYRFLRVGRQSNVLPNNINLRY